MTAKQRADELARRRAARSAAAAKPSPTKGKATKGKRKTGTVKRREATGPGTDAAAATTDADELPHVDAAKSDGDTVERRG